MSLIKKKSNMPLQDAKERVNNFNEVALGYDEKTALLEASRCLNCKNKPCVEGCPVNIDIPNFIMSIKEKDYEGAYNKITLTSSLPAVCGRVCPQETQCESKCTMGIKYEPVGIGRLERFVADYHNDNIKTKQKKFSSNNKKVAIIGSGPSGLTCAGDLLKKGYDVTIYEALNEAGGVLVYGIPEFRLPKSIVKKEIDTLLEYGVKIEKNVVIGKTLTIDDFVDMGYQAIFIGSGAGLPMFMNIKGESYNGVYSANEFLTRSNLMKAYREDSDTPIMKGGVVAVVGGGNVAMDAARTALRLGAKKVYIIYRRSEKELPARHEEVEHAKEEGVEFRLLNNPVEILGDETGKVKAIKVIKMELGEQDITGRRRPIEIKGSEYEIAVDTVIMALGTTPNPLIKNTTKGLLTDKRGCIVIDENASTSIKGVYAGGDAVTGAATVISAMGAGKEAAKNIDKYLDILL